MRFKAWVSVDPVKLYTASGSHRNTAASLCRLRGTHAVFARWIGCRVSPPHEPKLIEPCIVRVAVMRGSARRDSQIIRQGLGMKQAVVGAMLAMGFAWQGQLAAH